MRQVLFMARGPPSSRFKGFTKLAGLGAAVSSDAGARGEKLAATLRGLKGAAMKLGQAASMKPDLFSKEVLGVVSR